MNKIKRGALLLMGCMAQNVISDCQPLLENSNPPYNYQQVSDFAINTNQPLEVIMEQNITTVFWNISYSYDAGFITFFDNNNRIITTWQLNGKKSGIINIYGNAYKNRIFSYKLIVDDTVIGSYSKAIKTIEKDNLKVFEALSSK